MPRINPGAIRRERAAEVERLARVLEQWRICHAHPLFEAASECRDGNTCPDQNWAYTVANLIIRRPHKMRGVRPKNAVDIHHVIDVELVGVCEDTDFKGDPFERLSINVLARARSEERALVCAWHLDRHLTEIEVDEEAPQGVEGVDAQNEIEDAPEIHPLYHFHFGGHALIRQIDSEAADLGDILLLEPPRLVHPPMDAILAVDFVLSNFYPADRRLLWTDEGYVALVKGAQARCWRSYAAVCAAAWERAEFGTWSPLAVWPHLHIEPEHR